MCFHSCVHCITEPPNTINNTHNHCRHGTALNVSVSVSVSVTPSELLNRPCLRCGVQKVQDIMLAEVQGRCREVQGGAGVAAPSAPRQA